MTCRSVCYRSRSPFFPSLLYDSSKEH
uniref:Uncharacterized protein n=1 Tax=Arundo donax TaxID=35708 RepID=A0A0A9CA48_ARUDO